MLFTFYYEVSKEWKVYYVSTKNKNRKSNESWTVCLDPEISERKTVSVVALFCSSLLIRYLIVLLFKYLFFYFLSTLQGISP